MARAAPQFKSGAAAAVPWRPRLAYSSWGMRWLWVHAAPAEGEALARFGLWRRELGVGKTASSSALARALVRERPDGVVAVGVCGAVRDRGLTIGSRCVVGSDRHGDEGVWTVDGLLDLAALGLGHTGPWRAAPEPTASAASLLAAPVVEGLTVSSCSGTDGLARRRASTGCAIETMEGAAIAQVCADEAVPWVGLRTVSNYTGERARAGWDLAAALAALQSMLAVLVDARWPS